MATIKKLIQSAPRMRGSLPRKAQNGIKTADSTAYFKRASDSFMTTANDENKKGNEGTSRKLVKLAKSAFENQKRQSKKGKPGYDKNGFPVKAKDGKWMQKAAASIKKRGTAGKCTPITKPGCTGKAKALAKTFKAIAKKNKK